MILNKNPTLVDTNKRLNSSRYEIIISFEYKYIAVLLRFIVIKKKNIIRTFAFISIKL